MKLKEEVVFYADSSKSRAVFRFKARQRLDVAAEHDVFDEYGNVIGYFRKEFGASLRRSTWALSTPTVNAIGRERRQSIAILRRVWDFIPYLGDVWVPFVFHFDFVDTATGAPVLSSERVWSVRDRYDVTVPDPRLDFRLAASMAVALDAPQARGSWICVVNGPDNSTGQPWLRISRAVAAIPAYSWILTCRSYQLPS